MSVNKVILLGNIGKEPEIRTMPNGGDVATFSLATTENWKDKTTGEKKSKTEWHRVVAFGNFAAVVKMFTSKGSKVYLEGSLQTREYTDANGVKRNITEVVLQGNNAKIDLLDSIKQQDDSNTTETTAKNEESNDDDCNIPF